MSVMVGGTCRAIVHGLQDFSLVVKHDSGFDFVYAPNETDVSYHAVRAYYDIYEDTRQEHPGLLFEICNDGGRMVDFGSAAHGDYFSITDTYDPLSNRRAFYGTSYVLPAAMPPTRRSIGLCWRVWMRANGIGFIFRTAPPPTAMRPAAS